jgi:hypothetical protein
MHDLDEMHDLGEMHDLDEMDDLGEMDDLQPPARKRNADNSRLINQ